MPFLKLKKNRVSSEYDSMSSPAILPVQNVYSPSTHLSPPRLQDTIYDPNYKYRVFDTKRERDNRRETVMKEAEKYAQKRKKHSIYSRFLCCICFPCLPMWTRTVCCFLFLGISGLVFITLFFFFSFKQPQILFNGSNQHYSSQTKQTSMEFQYSIYNGNFFELNFENLRFVTYYPTANKTTMGIGEIVNLKLGPQAVTNVSIPVKIVGETENVFENMVIELCKKPDSSQKEIVITVDIMPTIRFLNDYVISLSLKGQKSKVSCNKLLQSTISNNLIEDFYENQGR